MGKEVSGVAMILHGRRMIKTDATEVTIDNVVTILRKALPDRKSTRLNSSH